MTEDRLKDILDRLPKLDPEGRKPKPRPARAELKRLYVAQGLSIREVASCLNYSKDMVVRALAEYGIERRPNAKRSRLRTMSLRALEAAVREKGIRGTAREMGVDEGTIRHQLKTRKARDK